MREDKEETRKHESARKDDVPHYAKTTYPADYKPPKIDEDPREIHQAKR